MRPTWIHERKTNAMKKREQLTFVAISLTLLSGVLFSSAAFSEDTDVGDESEQKAVPEQPEDDDSIDSMKAVDEAVQQREAIIALVEDELSDAYSFNSQSEYPIPHFEKLDALFPSWHHGEAANARQFWLTLDFHAQLVQYRVDYIYKVNDFTAVIGGKRLVVWTRDEKSSIIEKEFWPFQYWANLTRHKNGKCVKCIDVTYAAVFEMRLNMDENGVWTVFSEKFTDQPGIPNIWEEDCTLEKFLKDWGFKSTCGEEKSSLFG